jgi:hypothetical protein
MFEFFTNAWKFLTNRDERWSSKALILFVILSSIFLFELSTGLVSSIINSYRLDQIAKIDQALNASYSNKESKEYMQAAKDVLLKRGFFPSVTFGDIWNSFVSLIMRAKNLAEGTVFIVNSDESRISTMSPNRYVIFQLTSSSFIWIVAAVLQFLGFLKRGKFSLKKIGATISIQFVFLLLIIGSTYGFSLIPIDNAVFRLIINVTLQFLAIKCMDFFLEYLPRTPSQD